MCHTMPKSSCPLLQSAALPLVLQHDSLVADPRALMQFSWTSKGLQSAVLEHCKGRLVLHFGSSGDKQVEQFAAWVIKHGQLLGGLTLSPNPFGTRPLPSPRLPWQQVETKVAGALQHQVQQDGPVMLKQLEHNLAGEAAGDIIQAVSPCSLTSLVLRTADYPVNLVITRCDLAAFSKLEVLSVECLRPGQTQTIVSAMSALVSLKDLRLSGQFSAEQLAEMQPLFSTRITNLYLRSYVDTTELTRFPHQLQRLAALQKLDAGLISEECQLPQQLRQLHCVEASSALPLLSCTQLHQLQNRLCDTPATELSQLGDLVSITDISLRFSFSHPRSADRAAPAFSQAPLSTALKHLSIYLDAGNTALEAQTLQELRWLSGLTFLDLSVVDTPLPASPTELAAALQHLTALQWLELYADPGPHLLQPVLQPPPEPPAIGTLQALNVVNMLADHAAAWQVMGFAQPGELAAVVQATVAAGQPMDFLANIIQEEHPAAAQQLQQFIVQLQQLQQQQLQEQQEGEDEVWLAPCMLPLTEAIAELPQLISLKLKGSGLVLEAVDPLTRMTQLTRLTMAGEGFDDLALIKLAFSLSNLKRLSLSAAEQVTDSALLVVGQLLKQLTELELTNCTGVTDIGIMQLTGLLNLELLEADGALRVSNEAVSAVMDCISEQQLSAAAVAGV